MSTMAKVPGTLDAAEEQQKALAQHDWNRSHFLVRYYLL